MFYYKKYSTVVRVCHISKTINLRVSLNVIYRPLRDIRLEKPFPEFFIGITRKLVIDKENKERTFKTITQIQSKSSKNSDVYLESNSYSCSVSN